MAVDGLEGQQEAGVHEDVVDPKGDDSRSRADGRINEWRPVRSSGGRISVVMAIVALVCSIGAWGYALGRPIAIDSFVASVAGMAGLGLALAAAVIAYGYYSLRYRIENRGLIITWLWVRETVPLGAIEGLFGGHRFGKKLSMDGLVLHGHYVGTARAEGIGRVRFYGSSNDPSAALIVATANRGYAITPADLDGFRAQLIEVLESLPEEEIERAPEPKTSMPAIMRLSVLRDRVAIACLGVSIAVLVGSFGYVSYKFPLLPELMALHFNYAGEPDLIGPPIDAFRMPVIGVLICGFNAVAAAFLHRWRRDAGRVLAVATVFVQFVMLIAVVRVVH